MCDIMEKDVLIELVAYAQATLGQRLPLPFNEDQIYLAKLRNKIYATSHDDLDFNLLVSKIKSIINKYEHLPKII